MLTSFILEEAVNTCMTDKLNLLFFAELSSLPYADLRAAGDLLRPVTGLRAIAEAEAGLSVACLARRYYLHTERTITYCFRDRL